MNEFSKKRRQRETIGTLGGLFSGLLTVGFVGFFLVKCSGPDETITPDDLAQIEANQIAKEQAGFHCLSGWDGRHVRLVEKFKTTLRDPSSFEHDKTIIAPVDENGKHELMMRYRAKNGFGGMALGHVKAEVDNRTCGFRITDGS